MKINKKKKGKKREREKQTEKKIFFLIKMQYCKGRFCLIFGKVFSKFSALNFSLSSSRQYD